MGLPMQQIAALCAQRLKGQTFDCAQERLRSEHDVSARQALDILVAAQMLDIPKSIAFAAWEFRWDFAIDKEWFFPSLCRLPANPSALRLNFDGHEECLYLVYTRPMSPEIATEIIRVDPLGNAATVGAFVAGSGTILTHKRWRNHIGAATDLVGCIAMLLALIAEPRFVATARSGSRQGARFNHRGFGFAVDAWHSCSWNIGTEVVAKLSRDPGFHKIPLHFRRGHWRRTTQAAPKAEWIDASVINNREAGFYVRIEGDFVGHPAFGIKRHIYTPRITPEVLARKGGST